MQGFHVATSIKANALSSENNPADSFATAIANYGMINSIWSFSRTDSVETIGLWNMTDTHVAFTGMRMGKGNFGIAIYNTNRAFATAASL